MCAKTVHFYRFKAGLETLGVLQCMQQYPATMQEAFIYTPTVIDALAVEAVFTVSQRSPHGSNRYQNETRTETYWRDLLQDLEGL